MGSTEAIPLYDGARCRADVGISWPKCHRGILSVSNHAKETARQLAFEEDVVVEVYT